MIFFVLYSLSTWGQSARMVIDSEDEAFVVFKKETSEAGAVSITEILSPNVDIIEYVDGTLECFEFSSQCFFNVRLKKHAGINFGPYDLSTIPYGYARVDTLLNSAYIDLDLWGYTNFHIADLLTLPAETPEASRIFSSSPAAEGSKVGETNDYLEIRVRVFLAPNLTSEAEYQRYQILASGVAFPSGVANLWNDGRFLGKNYYLAEGNKGQAFANPQSDLLNFWVNNWNSVSGHYVALRIFTNGSSELDKGIDLTGFTQVELTMNCELGIVVEVFVGAGVDSSQNFVGEIYCDDRMNTYNFSIPTGSDLSEIQTGLWLHVPVWKNPGIFPWGPYFNIDSAILKK